MSIMFDRLRSNPLSEEVAPETTPFRYGRSEGAPYLFFNEEDLQDLMGHEIKYYPCGVLLVFKDSLKEHENESSYMFFNNSGKQVFEISNIKHNGYSDRKKPTTEINLSVKSNMLHVNIVNIETKETEEYFVSVKDGKKIYDVFEKKEETHLSI